MGSTLSHWDVEFAAGLCYFKSNDEVAFIAAMLAGRNASQDESLLKLFAARISLAPQDFNGQGRPACFLLDTFSPNVSEGDGHAIFQLAYHLAGAYFCWQDV